MNRKDNYTTPINLNDNWIELDKKEMDEFKRNLMLDPKYRCVFNNVLRNMFKSKGE